MSKFIAILSIILFLLQFSFLPFLGYNINLLLILVIILSQKRFDLSGISWIFFCGLLMDTFSSNMFGVNILSFILVAVLVDLANSFFVAFESNRVINSVVYLVGKLFFDLASFFIGKIFVLTGLSTASVIYIPKILSLEYVFHLLLFSFFGFCLFVFYEKLENISGEKRQDLKIS